MRLWLCLLFLVACNGSSNGGDSKPSISSVQRAEIDKLRSELNAAFEAGEPEQVSWTSPKLTDT